MVFAASWISPAGRVAWVDERLPRWGMVASVLIGLLLVGLLPPPAPTAVAGFGAPIESVEDAGFPWPHIEEQHHLLTGDRDGVDVAVVTVSTMRVPWQGTATGMSGGVLFLADLLNMAEREMRDTVLLLTESALRSSMRQAGIEQSCKFTWRKSADLTLAALSVARRPLDSDSLSTRAEAA